MHKAGASRISAVASTRRALEHSLKELVLVVRAGKAQSIGPSGAASGAGAGGEEGRHESDDIGEPEAGDRVDSPLREGGGEHVPTPASLYFQDCSEARVQASFLPAEQMHTDTVEYPDAVRSLLGGTPRSAMQREMLDPASSFAEESALIVSPCGTGKSRAAECLVHVGGAPGIVLFIVSHVEIAREFLGREDQGTFVYAAGLFDEASGARESQR